PRRKKRSGAPGSGAIDLRENVGICQSSGSVRGRDRLLRRSIGESPAGVYTPFIDQRCVQSGPDAECQAVVMHPGEWAGPGLNRRHMDFQSIALPTELPARQNAEILGVKAEFASGPAAD